MEIDFKNIAYLNAGNEVQKNTYRLINNYNILQQLQAYQPIVVGTIPININIEGSDVDIVLYTLDFNQIEAELYRDFSQFDDFQLERIGSNVIVCGFSIEGQLFELYATDRETEQQNGYLHMIKEYEIMQIMDEDFASEIRTLKKAGVKTEPAFCQLLQLHGNPYEELLKYQP